MLETILTIVATAVLAAVLSSLLTAWLMRRGFETRVKPELQRELEQRLRQAVDGLGPLIRQRVREGVVDAVRSVDLVQETRRSVLRSASDLVEGGLSSLLGASPRKRDRGPDED